MKEAEIDLLARAYHLILSFQDDVSQEEGTSIAGGEEEKSSENNEYGHKIQETKSNTKKEIGNDSIYDPKKNLCIVR